MDTPFTNGPDDVGESYHGYPRVLVDDFIAAAARERSRLEELRRAASIRAERARATIGVHRVMMAMMLDTQREVSEIRRAADIEASNILADAEQHVSEILGTPVFPGLDAPNAADGFAPLEGPATELVDLTAVEHAESYHAESYHAESYHAESYHAESYHATNDVHVANGVPTTGDENHAEEFEEYFAFLRGALVDDQPLGPGPERSASGR